MKSNLPCTVVGSQAFYNIGMGLGYDSNIRCNRIIAMTINNKIGMSVKIESIIIPPFHMAIRDAPLPA